MCGIAGVLRTDGRDVELATLTRMSKAVAHRGPDGDGLWTHGSVGFSHRRLAIIDLQGGRQPMVAPDSGCVLIFNGEIYNFAALRKTLQAEGSTFIEQSDTEVVLRAYERWGEAAVDRLQGMFAFAIWNPRTRQLFAARDRIGIKPFYYRWLDGTLTFASELKAILASDPTASRTLDVDSFDRYLRLQYVPAPRTIVQGVRQLPPGHTLTLNVDSRQLAERRYWQAHAIPSARGAPDRPDRPGSRSPLPSVAQFQQRIGEAVRSHMVADVPIGALLSGGVDSSLIAAHMVREASAAVHTFSVGFEDSDLDERHAAHRVATHLGTVHHEQVVSDRDAADTFPRLVAAMDEPLADYAALPTYLIARFAAQHVKVVLTGEGADELFAGYRRYRRDTWLAPFAALRPTYQPSHVFSRRETSRLIGRVPSEFERESNTRNRTVGTLNRLLLRDIEGWLPDDLLVKVDRMTMLCSLEARVPYLDHQFVEWALAVPGAHKLSLLGGRGKLLLRQAAATMMPEDVAGRKKQGFKPPIDAWLRGRMRELAQDTLLAANTNLRDRIDARAIRQLLEDHNRGDANGHRIWTLLVFELWSQEHGVG